MLSGLVTVAGDKQGAHVKPLSHVAALPLRLHGVCKKSLSAVISQGKLAVAFLPGSMWFLRRSSWRLLVLSLRSHEASTACIELSRRAHCVYTGRSRCSTALTEFCLHSMLEPKGYYASGFLRLRLQNLRIGKQ